MKGSDKLDAPIARGDNPDKGSVLRPMYSERQMKCYAVTESELQQIGLANLFSTVLFGIGSALIAFGIDVFKDTLFAGTVPEPARILSQVVQPICLGLDV